MAKMQFTDRGVDALTKENRLPKKPKETRYFERQKKGLSLMLIVSHSGVLTWHALFYKNGKPRTEKLGTYPAMKVAHARKEAHKFDPEKANASADAGTFEDVAEQWLLKYVGKKRLRTTYEIKRQLTVYLYPAWAKVRIFDIDRLKVNRLLDSIEKRSGAPMADYCLATMRSIFNWYAVQDHKFNSPLVKGMNRDMREPKERARWRILDDAEIRQVWGACSKLGTYGSLVRVLLLTAQRLGCVKSMKRRDVVDSVWTIPEQHREKGHIGAVTLPKMAFDIIEAQPIIAGNDHVFPAAKGKGPLASFSRGKKELDALLPKDMPGWVLHDLRRTARSLLSKIGIPRDLAERVLGHTSGGVEAIYDRYKYVPEKSDALQKLAVHVSLIINPPDKTNVVPMRKRSRRSARAAGAVR